jgi:hypothetical protein
MCSNAGTMMVSTKLTDSDDPRASFNSEAAAILFIARRACWNSLTVGAIRTPRVFMLMA